MGGTEQRDGWGGAGAWVERCGGIGGAVREHGRSGAGGWVERRRGMGGVAQWDESSGVRAWVERRRGVGGVAQGDGWGGAARGDGWYGAEGWEERRRSMGVAVRGHGRSGAGVWVWRCEGMGGAARGHGRSGAEGTSKLRGNGGGSNKKDAVLKGRTRRLQTLNSVWKGNYCSGIGDGGAIKSTKQREASAVPYRFVMVIPSVMKLSSPK